MFGPGRQPAAHRAGARARAPTARARLHGAAPRRRSPRRRGSRTGSRPRRCPTRHLYACANVVSTHRLTRLNIATPTFTRAPGEASGNFALESRDGRIGVRAAASIRSSCACATTRARPRARAARTRASRCASAIGSRPSASAGQRRSAAPGEHARRALAGRLRHGDRDLSGQPSAARSVGRGCCPTAASSSSSATHDLGTGTYTVMSQVAADALGVPIARVRFELGDSRFPEGAGRGRTRSRPPASAPAVQAAARGAAPQARSTLAHRRPASFAYGSDPAQITVVDGWLRSASAPPPTLGRPLADAAGRASRSPPRGAQRRRGATGQRGGEAGRGTRAILDARLRRGVRRGARRRAISASSG